MINLCVPGLADDAVLDPKIRALGRLEPDAGLIDLSTTAGEQRIQALLADEGQVVSKGQPLVRLVGYDAQAADIEWLKEQVRTAQHRLAGELALRKTRLASAKIRQEQTRVLDLEKIHILEHEIVSLTAELEYHRLELDRAQTLSSKAVLPDNTHDLKKMELVRAREALNTARAKLKHQKALALLNQEEAKSEQENILAESTVREVEIGLKNLEKELGLAKNKLASYVVPSPVDGVILTVLTRAGEVPSTLPILKMADIRNMVAIAEVYETDLTRVRLGQKAVVTSPALPKKLTGEVVRISRLIFKRTIRDVDPFQPLDYRVAEVRVRLDDPETASRFIQLQVDVELDGMP